jgi:hypothetical protein
MENEFTEPNPAQSDSAKPSGITAPGTNRESAGWHTRWQWLRPSTLVQQQTLSNSGILNMQVWLGRAPWRPAAAWAMLAGLLSGGLFVQPTDLAWSTVVLLLLLVDPLWGSLWRIAGGRAELLSLRDESTEGHVSLPYLKSGSPAAKLLDRNMEDVLPVLFRVVFPSMVLALLVASALDMVAIAVTCVVILLAGMGWISTRRAHRVPVLLHSLVSIGLPMFLAAWLLNDTVANRTQMNALSAAQIALIVLWTLHQWGTGRVIRFSDEHLGLLVLGIADIGIGVLLLWVQAPLWLALWLAMSLPTWLLIVQRRPLQRAAIWQLCAMLVSAAGVGQGL